MGDACEDCKTWEDKMFWTHFQSVHFTQFLRDNFTQQLALPEKFTKHFKKKLSGNVTLKGPSGFTWDVGLTGNGDTLFFDNGWPSFVKDHSLKENDFLVFKSNGVSHFDVLVFDGLSLCEKATSYFVKKCGHTEHDSGSHTKRKLNENPVEITHPSPLEETPEKSAENDNDQTGYQRLAFSSPAYKKTRNGGYSRKPTQPGWRAGNLSPNGQEKVKHEPDSMPIDLESERFVSEEQKRNALLLAHSALRSSNSEGFVIVMKPTHVNRKFFMAIPTAWMSKYMTLEPQDVIVRCNGNLWRTRFTYYPNRGYGGLSTGWRSFAFENDLEEFDVCIFECTDPSKRPMTLDVKIFPVSQAAIPLNEVAALPLTETEVSHGSF